MLFSTRIRQLHTRQCGVKKPLELWHRMVLPMEVQFTAVFDKVVFVFEAYTIISMEFKERYHENITN